MNSSVGLCPAGELKLEARASPLYSAHLCQRAAFLIPVNRACANDCCFRARASLRHILVGSAFTSPRRRFLRGVFNETAKFALCYGPLAGPPYSDKGFYFRASIRLVTETERRV